LWLHDGQSRRAALLRGPGLPIPLCQAGLGMRSGRGRLAVWGLLRRQEVRRGEPHLRPHGARVLRALGAWLRRLCMRGRGLRSRRAPGVLR